jgi:hypothetical protein
VAALLLALPVLVLLGPVLLLLVVLRYPLHLNCFLLLLLDLHPCRLLLLLLWLCQLLHLLHPLHSSPRLHPLLLLKTFACRLLLLLLQQPASAQLLPVGSQA